MKLHRLAIGFFLLSACETAGNSPAGTGGASGGATPSGGSTAASGGSTSRGGGTAASGGSTASGGSSTASGGNTAASGGSTAASGGSTASGGNTAASGGSNAPGGSTASGGRSGSGGAGNGGASSSGGAGTGGGSGSGGAAGRNGSSGRDGGPDADSGAGGAGNGGAKGTGGAAGVTGACRPKFASGVNVAWFNYAADIPSPDMTKFGQLFSDTFAVGGRIVRWWFHTNGSKTPTYDATTGLVAKISDANIADIKKILDGAAAAGQAVVVSVWSFNMMKSDQVSATILQNNKDLLQKDANRQAYVDNVITPLVTALKGHPGLYAWEVFNEPEGMIDDGPNPTPWTGSNYVSITDIQKCVNWFAAGIHAADPSALVTNAAWTFLANTDVDGHKNYYSNSQLTSIGGKSNGTLDFYEIHYYDNWGTVGGANSVSPFVNPASHWALDKPIMIGEFWDIDSPGPSNSTIKGADLYTTLYNNGYQGGWAWQYANADSPPPSNGEPTEWPAMKTAMQNLYSAHPADLACK